MGEEEEGQRGEATTSILGLLFSRRLAPFVCGPSSRWLPMVQVALWGRQQVRGREGHRTGQDKGASRRPQRSCLPTGGSAVWVGTH